LAQVRLATHIWQRASSGRAATQIKGAEMETVIAFVLGGLIGIAVLILVIGIAIKVLLDDTEVK